MTTTTHRGTKGDASVVITDDGVSTWVAVKAPSGDIIAMTSRRGTIANAAAVILGATRLARSLAGVTTVQPSTFSVTGMFRRVAS